MAQDAMVREAEVDADVVEMERAFAHYAALRPELEERANDQFATVDVADGRYVIGLTRFGATAAFRSLHGERPAWTFHIGTS